LFKNGPLLAAEIARGFFSLQKSFSKGMDGIQVIQKWYLLADIPRIRPMPIRTVQRDDPPYERKNKGIPVIGIIPMVIPTLIVK